MHSFQQRNTAWQPLATSSLTAAHAAAREIADRLRSPEITDTAIQGMRSQSAYPEITKWQPWTSAAGDTGIALFFSYLDRCFPDEGWDQTGHMYLQRAIQPAILWRERPIGLFVGLSGLLFAAWSLSREESRYGRLISKVETMLLPGCLAEAEQIRASQQAIQMGQYDIITGLAGASVSLLCLRHHPEIAPVLSSVLEALVAVMHSRNGQPGWYTPPSLAFPDDWREAYPDGYYNCGLAHGMPGPLASLALAKLHGVCVSGCEEAISSSADWLLAHHIEDAWGLNWTDAVSAGRVGESFTDSVPSRAGWCYGAPGIARALWLAGNALNNDEYRQAALEAMKAVYRRPIEVRLIPSSTFCHGVAGLLQITLRFAHETGDELFFKEADILLTQLLSLYDPSSLLGYRNQETSQNTVDSPALLDGAAGVALVLLAATTARVPDWDRLFLLS